MFYGFTFVLQIVYATVKLFIYLQTNEVFASTFQFIYAWKGGEVNTWNTITDKEMSVACSMYWIEEERIRNFSQKT
jgi:hypothetical protein